MLNIILFKSSSLISCQILVLYSEIRKTLPIMIVLLQPNLRTLPSYSCINSISTMVMLINGWFAFCVFILRLW